MVVWVGNFRLEKDLILPRRFYFSHKLSIPAVISAARFCNPEPESTDVDQRNFSHFDSPKLIVGWREWLAIPEFDIPWIEAKVIACLVKRSATPFRLPISEMASAPTNALKTE